mgnify:FL=1
MHTWFSPDCDVSPQDLVDRCIKVGLACIAVTDHNTIEGALAVQAIAPFPVIIGEEVASSEGEITGLFLQESIPKGLSPVETAIRIKKQGGLVSIPHPFDRFRGQVISKKALDDLVDYADIVEVFNSRNNLSSDDKKAQKFATKHNLLTSGVSDAHTIMELGRTYIEMPEFDGTPDGFKTALYSGEIVGRRMNPLIHTVTTFTKIKKKLKSRFRHHPNK